MDIANEAQGVKSLLSRLFFAGNSAQVRHLNADTKPPMQSVFKLPLALTVLHQVEQGSLSLDQAGFTFGRTTAFCRTPIVHCRRNIRTRTLTSHSRSFCSWPSPSATTLPPTYCCAPQVRTQSPSASMLHHSA